MSRISQIRRGSAAQSSQAPKSIPTQSQLYRREQKQISRLPTTESGGTQGKLARVVSTAPAKVFGFLYKDFRF